MSTPPRDEEFSLCHGAVRRIVAAWSVDANGEFIEVEVEFEIGCLKRKERERLEA